MAVGKGSMERASKAAAKPEAEGTKAAKISTKAPAKSPVKAKAAASGIIGDASKEVMEKIVYRSSSQMLDRDAMPGETFAIGDAMPVYFF